MSENKHELMLEIVENEDVAEVKATSIVESFKAYFDNIAKLEGKARKILVQTIDDLELMTAARETRLELRALRVDADKTRKKLKEQSLREGRAIDGIGNLIKAMIVPLEEHLDEQENFVKKLEEAEIQKTKDGRIVELTKYGMDGEGLDLGNMSPDIWENYLAGVKKTCEDRIAAERKEEEDRIAKEKAEMEERKRIEEENAKLKEEAIAREKEAATEKAKAEKAIADERAKADKLEADRVKAEEEKIAKEAQERIAREKEAQEKVEDKKAYEKVKAQFPQIQDAWVEIVRLRKIAEKG